LLWHDGLLYESTGQRGRSSVREVDPVTGDVLRIVPVSRPEEQLTGDNPLPDYFAEGLELVDDRLIQLTWTEGEAFVYDVETLERVDTIAYEGEGWGLCYDERYLYMSDSTQYIAIREADSFELVGRMLVTLNGQPIQSQLLNELECVGDLIYANLWQTDFIAMIDKYSGNIVGLVDARQLLTQEMIQDAAGAVQGADGTWVLPSNSVLNGIAYNPDTDTFFITGKDWPRLFEVRFVPAS
jgi:glutaminyl-peptide cyclotransferase